MFEYKLLILISELLMSSVAKKYRYYIDKIYGKCQIVDYRFDDYPYVYQTVIVGMEYERGYIAKESDVGFTF